MRGAAGVHEPAQRGEAVRVHETGPEQVPQCVADVAGVEPFKLCRDRVGEPGPTALQHLKHPLGDLSGSLVVILQRKQLRVLCRIERHPAVVTGQGSVACD